MNRFNIAIVSPSSPKDIAGILTVYADDKKAAMKKVKDDPAMEGVRIYPIDDDKLTEH